MRKIITSVKDLETYADEYLGVDPQHLRDAASELAIAGQTTGLRYGQDWSEYLDSLNLETFGFSTLEQTPPESYLTDAYNRGFEDGMDAFTNSGSTADPVNGWDGDLINAIGSDGIARLFELPKSIQANGEWTQRAKAALAEYVRGCREGCEDAKRIASCL